MADRITLIGPDGRRNVVQSTHCTADNLRMVYNLPGDLYLEVPMSDGSTELIFAERSRFVGLVSGIEYHVRGSAAPPVSGGVEGGGGAGANGAGGRSVLAAARERGSQRAVRFAAEPQSAPQPWEVAAQAAAATPWDPQPAQPAAPQQQPQRRQPAPWQQSQAPPQGGRPGAFNPSSAEVEAILARTGGPLGGGGQPSGARGPGSTGPIRMGGGPPGGAYGGSTSAHASRQPLPSGPGIDGPGPTGRDIFSVGDFQTPAGAASGAGAETRPRSRGGVCLREGIMPVSRGLRDTPWQAGRAGGGGRFDAAATGLEGTHTQTHATSASRGVLPGT